MELLSVYPLWIFILSKWGFWEYLMERGKKIRPLRFCLLDCVCITNDPVVFLSVYLRDKKMTIQHYTVCQVSNKGEERLLCVPSNTSHSVILWTSKKYALLSLLNYSDEQVQRWIENTKEGKKNSKSTKNRRAVPRITAGVGWERLWLCHPTSECWADWFSGRVVNPFQEH